MSRVRQDDMMSTMSMSRALPVAIGAIAIIAASVPAEGQSLSSLEQLFGEPVTTSVTGSPQRASDAPATMLIITAEDIRRSGARDIPGVLSRYAGLDVQRRTGDHADVAIRGYNQAFSPRLLVLVDGRQVYADYYGFTPWSTVPVELEAIRQIEVVKGPNGALFGFNAVGGVINIITFDPLEDDAFSAVSSRAGTQDLAEVSAVKAFRFSDSAALRISAGSRRTDDFSTPLQPVDEGSRRGNERDAVAADAHVELSPNVALGVEATYSTAAQAEVPPLYTLSYTDYETSSLRTHWSADTRFGLVKANLYRNSIEADAFLMGDQTPFLRFDNDVLVAQLEDVFKVGSAHVVRVAGEYRDNSMTTTPIERAEVFYDVLSLTAMWNWSITPALSLTNAVRLDEWSLGRSGFVPPELAPLGVSNELWDISRDELSFNTGLVWRTERAGTFRFGAASAEQLPNLLNLGGLFLEVPGFYLVGSPELLPSDVTSYEVDWERAFEPSGLRLRLGAFHGTTRDVQASFANVGASRTTGFEATIEGRLAESWSWSASYLSQQIEDRFTDAFPPESTLVDFERTSPEGVLKAHLGWARGPWEVDGFVRHTSSFEGFRGLSTVELAASFVPVPRHTAVDARAAYAFGERFRIAVSGRNLTHSSQRQTSSPEVERQVFATFEFAL